MKTKSQSETYNALVETAFALQDAYRALRDLDAGGVTLKDHQEVLKKTRAALVALGIDPKTVPGLSGDLMVGYEEAFSRLND